MSTRTRFTLMCLAGVMALGAAACAPLPSEAEVPPSETTASTTTTSTTTTSTTVLEIDPNDWVGQCFSIPDSADWASLTVGSVLLDDGEHWVAEFPLYDSSDCSGGSLASGWITFGEDPDDGDAACKALFWGLTDGGTMAERWGVALPPEARFCRVDPLG